MRIAGLGFASVLMWLSAAGIARAGFVFEFGQAGSSPVSDFVITAVGDTVDVQVYLREFGSPGDILATELLFSSAVALTFDGTIAKVQDELLDITPAPDFDVINFVSASTNEAALDVAAFLNPLVPPDPDNRILLGTFRFTGVSVGTTAIRVSDLTPGLDETNTGDFTPLDDLIGDGWGAIAVQGGVVPEPTSLTLWGSLAVCGLVALWRRGRRRKDAVTG
ncbi:MAG TPA: hypothetical protein VMY37_11470 [Thermoguttaceae bacterium]|nr:hypothetical protein [Thermoguttaceae bacterium]